MDGEFLPSDLRDRIQDLLKLGNVTQADLTVIQTQFMSAMKEVKQKIGDDLSVAQKMISQIAQKMIPL